MTRPAAAPSPLVFTEPVALIGGAPADADGRAAALARAGAVVAADGGANGFTPGGDPRLDAVIGDMDSVRDLAAWRAEPSCHVAPIAEQDTTDLEKCLYTVDAPLYIGSGFLGDRLDHTLAAAHALLRHPHRRVVLIGEVDLLTLCPPRMALSVGAGVRVSIFPLRPVRALWSKGLRWPLDGLELAAGKQVGTSNVSVSSRVVLAFEAFGAVLMLPRDRLDAVIEALRDDAFGLGKEDAR